MSHGMSWTSSGESSSSARQLPPLTPLHARTIHDGEIPDHFKRINHIFHAQYLPPLPRIRDPLLSAAARDPGRHNDTVPNVQELALLGDTVLKTIIMESIQAIAVCGNSGSVSRLSSHLNTNLGFSYLTLAYGILDARGRTGYRQKSYADVFEAYIGALWREGDHHGKAQVRLLVRSIFSPAVYPVLAEWKAGRRDFGQVRSLGSERRMEMKRFMALEARLQGERSQGISRHWDIGRMRRLRSRSASPPPMKRQRRISRSVIDFTIGDSDDEDDSDSDSVESISASEWQSLSARYRSSRTPSVFVDVNPHPSLPLSAVDPTTRPINNLTVIDSYLPRHGLVDGPPQSSADSPSVTSESPCTPILVPISATADPEIDRAPDLVVFAGFLPTVSGWEMKKRKRSDDEDLKVSIPPCHPHLPVAPDWVEISPIRSASSESVQIRHTVPSTPLGKLGQVLGSVKSKVGSVFRRRAGRSKEIGSEQDS